MWKERDGIASSVLVPGAAGRSKSEMNSSEQDGQACVLWVLA